MGQTPLGPAVTSPVMEPPDAQALLPRSETGQMQITEQQNSGLLKIFLFFIVFSIAVYIQ